MTNDEIMIKVRMTKNWFALELQTHSYLVIKTLVILSSV